MRRNITALVQGVKYLAYALIATPLVHATKGHVPVNTVEIGLSGVALLLALAGVYVAISMLTAGAQYYEHFFGSGGGVSD